MMASSRERSAAVTSNVIPVRIPNRRTIPNGWESQDGIFRRDQSTRYMVRRGEPMTQTHDQHKEAERPAKPPLPNGEKF
jgi:hypothetical protein